VDEEGIGALRDRARGPLQGEWLAVQADTVSRPQLEPAALCFLISEDDFYLGLARERIRRLAEEESWAGSPYDPGQNRDLKMGRSLVSLSIAYDLLHSCLAPEERDAVRKQLAHNCRLTHSHYIGHEGDWEYAQNHPYLPMVGMALAGYSLFGEEEDAEDWVKLAETFMERTFRCNGADGWYYEGWGYWRWAVPFLALYAEAHYQMTGQMDALSQPLIRNLSTYVRYMVLPGGQEAFDFADTHPMYIPEFERLNRRAYETEWVGVPWRQIVPLSGGRDGLIEDPKVFCPVETVDLVAARFRDAQAQQLADYLRLRGHGGPNIHRSLLWRDPDLSSGDTDGLPRGHYFDDHEVAIWRSGWDEKAMAVAIKCGPPAGHANADRLEEYPDFRMQAWHAHPDAGSFILWSHGQFLCTDTGYTHPKRTVDHNCLLINGRGQEEAYAAFSGVPYSRLNGILLSRVDVQEGHLYAVADMSAAYPPELEMDRIERRFLATEGLIVVWDLLESTYPHDYTWLLHTDTDYREVDGAYRTRKGDVELGVRFLHPTDLSVDVQKTVVITHQHMPRGSGPPHERGCHLEARQRGARCEYVACLAWGWAHEAPAEVTSETQDGRLSVYWKSASRSITLILSDAGAAVDG
jgi:hypothetical protein